MAWLKVARELGEPERRSAGLTAAGADILIFAREAELADADWQVGLASRVGVFRGVTCEPSLEWAALLAERGVSGAIGAA